MCNFLYSEDHLWFEFDNNTVKFGITDYLKNRTAPIFIDVPDVGEVLNSQDSNITLESKKITYKLAVPFCGKIIRRNEELLSNPEFILQQQEHLNWLCVVEICDDEWKSDLMNYDDYEAYIEP